MGTTVAPGVAAPLLSIIVPVFNEAGTLAAVLDRLRCVHLPMDREIIVVNDGSTDGTGDILAGLGGVPGLTVLHADRNRGKGHAIRLGLNGAARDDRGDPGRRPRARPRADRDARAADPRRRSGCRLRLAVPRRDARTRRWRTIAANRFLTTLTNILFGSSITDMETCYKVMRTDVARSLGLVSNRFDIEPEITAKLLRRGHEIVERPVRFDPRSRAAGKKIGWRDGVEAMRTLIRIRLAGKTASE